MQIEGLKKFNAKGEQRFHALVSELPENFASELESIINDAQLTVDSRLPNICWEVPVLRKDVGAVLHPYVGAGKPLRNFAGDRNLWNWVAAAYLASQKGDAKVLAAARKDAWVMNDDSQRYYRHVMFSAYFVFENQISYLDEAGIILDVPVSKSLGEMGEQLLATAEIAYTVGLRVADALYYDHGRKTLKRGASSKSPGAARRLTAAFLNQIKLNVDFTEMSVDQIINLLPHEFDKYKPAAAVSSDYPDVAEANESEGYAIAFSEEEAWKAKFGF